ncbi:chemotaxis protein CheX [Pseudoxanthomonas kaohsiungensis]|uniref:Chemotaxis protein CheX n=1 Tax=Pseudoxanthomonas kaohsiungensis TaxID=283923 RepID=A0ABW3LXQ0_9GAMM|nr:chemotaxis protein CheX [Pseudoxanthomonas kaohsiungensis]KAF1701751.1 chemotaxis protein CheX [Pseudoxanthomonas kaohsiungensis]
MAVKFLGQFLMERGVITPQQLLAAIEAQRASNPLLGELAVRQGLLTEAQARRINDRQRADDRRFGDIAMEMGLLEPAQVAGLLIAQKAGRKLFGEVLLEQGVVDLERLESELAAHRAEQDAAQHALEVGVADHALAELANGAIALSGRLFPRMLDSQCQAAGVLAPEDLQVWPHTAHVRIDGEQPMFIGMACGPETMQAMACAFLKIGPERCDEELALDGLGEIVNVLMGYVVRNVLPDDVQYRAFPPDLATPAAQLAADRDRSLALLMNSRLGPFVLLVGD